MRNYLAEFHRNLDLTERLLSHVNQSIKNPPAPKGFIEWFRNLFPITYCTFWIVLYTYLMFFEDGGLDLIVQQIWCMMSIMQVWAKMINSIVQQKKITELLAWCENVYAAPYKPDYKPIVNNIFEKTNFIIALLLKLVV